MYKFQTVYSPLLTSDWLAMCNVYCTLLCSYWLAMCSATLPLVGHVHYLYSPTLRLVGLLGRVQDQWIRIRLFAFVYQSWSQISKSLKELNNRKNSKLCSYFFKSIWDRFLLTEKICLSYLFSTNFCYWIWIRQNAFWSLELANYFVQLLIHDYNPLMM